MGIMEKNAETTRVRTGLTGMCYIGVIQGLYYISFFPTNPQSVGSGMC